MFMTFTSMLLLYSFTNNLTSNKRHRKRNFGVMRRGLRQQHAAWNKAIKVEKRQQDLRLQSSEQVIVSTRKMAWGPGAIFFDCNLAKFIYLSRIHARYILCCKWRSKTACINFPDQIVVLKSIIKNPSLPFVVSLPMDRTTSRRWWQSYGILLLVPRNHEVLAHSATIKASNWFQPTSNNIS